MPPFIGPEHASEVVSDGSASLWLSTVLLSINPFKKNLGEE
jgi:hypothetical protein